MMANRREGFRFFYKLIECFDHCPSLPASSEIRASLKSRDYNRLLDKILNYIWMFRLQILVFFFSDGGGFY